MSPVSPHLTDNDLHRIRSLVDAGLRTRATATLDLVRTGALPPSLADAFET